MSTEIDERVVRMEFDNAEFERNIHESIDSIEELKDSLDFDGCGEGLEEIGKEAKKVKMDVLGDSVEEVSKKFSVLETVALGALLEIGRKAENTASRMIKSLSTDNIANGWTKYAEKTTSVQTIMSATGRSIGYINEQLDKLVWFTDETSYKLTDMTNNIGKFTSQGVDLETSVTAMQGISTWASLAGQGVNEASRAMYNLSQALGVGSVKLMDWRSIENANMGTKQFKEQALEAAAAVGTLTKSYDSLGNAIYKTKSKGTQVTATNFANTLSEGWFTSTALLKTLDVYGGFANGLYEVFNSFGDKAQKTTSEIIDDLKNLRGAEDQTILDAGYAEEQIELFKELAEQVESIGAKAMFAAQEAKTFTEAIDSVKEAVASGWMRTFEAIFGNYKEAKVLWTDLSNALYAIFAEGGNERNEYLEEILGETDDTLEIISKFTGLDRDLVNSMKEVGDTYGYESDTFMEMMNVLTNGNEAAAEQIASLFQYKAGVKDFSEVISESSGITAEQSKELSELATKYGTASKEYNDYLDVLAKGNPEYREILDNMAKVSEQFGRVTGRDMIAESIINVLERVGEALTVIRKAFNDTFKQPAEDIYEIIRAVRNFTASLPRFTDAAGNAVGVGEKLYRVFKGAFAVVKIFATVIKELVIGFLDLVSPLGEVTGGIFDLAANLGDSLVTLQETIEETGAIKTVVTGIVKVLRILAKVAVTIANSLFGLFSELGGLLKDVFSYLGEITGLGKAFEKVKNEILGFNDETEEAEEHTNIFVKIIAALVAGLEACKNGIKKVRELVQSKFQSESFQKFADVLVTIKEALGKVWNFLKDIFAQAKTKFNEVFGEFNLERFLTLLTQLLTGGILSQVLVIVTKFKIAMGTIGSLSEEFFGLFEPVRKTLLLWQQSIRANTLLKIAGAIGILSVSLIALSFVKTQPLYKALLAIEALFVGLSVTMLATSKVFKALEGVQGFKSILSGYQSLIYVGAAMLLISKALVNVSKYEKDLWQSVGAVAALMLLMEGMMALNTFVGNKWTEGNAIKNAAGMLIFVHGINVLIKALAKLNSNELIWDGYKKLAAISGLLSGMYTVIALSSRFTASRKIKAATTAMVVATAMLAALVGLTTVAAKIPSETITAGVVNLAKVAGIIAGLELVYGIASGLSKGFSSLKATAELVAVVGAIGFLTALATAIGALAKYDLVDLSAGFAYIAGFAVVIGALELIYALSVKLQTFKSSFIKTMHLTAMVSGIVALSVVAAAIGALAKYNLADLEAGTVVIVVLAGVIAGLNYFNTILVSFDDSKKQLAKTAGVIATVNGIVVLAVAVAGLGALKKAGVNFSRGLLVLGALTILVGAIAGFSNYMAEKSSDNLDSFAKSVAKLVGAVAALGILTVVLGAMPVYFLAKGAVVMVVLSGMVLALGYFVNALSKLDKSGKSFKAANSYKSATKLIWSCVGAVAALGAVAVALGFVPINELVQGMAAMAALGLFVTVIATLLSLVGLIKTDEKRMYGLSAALAAFSIAMLALLPVVKMLGEMSYNQLNQGMVAAGLMGAFLVAIYGALAFMSKYVAEKSSFVAIAGAIVGPLAIVGGILAMIPAIKELGSIDPTVLENGKWAAAFIGGFITILYSVAAAVGAATGGIGIAAMAVLAAGMVVAAQALKMMIDPLQELSQIPNLGKVAGYLAMLGPALLSLGLGCTMMSIGLGGALALRIITPALDQLADVIIKYNGVDWNTLLNSLAKFITVTAGLGLVLTVFGLASPLMLAASAAFATFALACSAGSLAVVSFAWALSKMDDAVVKGSENFKKIGPNIAKAIMDIKVIVAEGTGEIIKILCAKIAEAAPDVEKALMIYVPLVAKLKLRIAAIVAAGIPVVLAAAVKSLDENYDIIRNGIVSLAKKISADAVKAISVFTAITSSSMKASGAYVGSGLILGISSMFGPLGIITAQAALIVTKVFEKSMDINSPSKVSYGWGYYICAGLANGIAENSAQAATAVFSLGTRIKEAWNNAWSNYKNGTTQESQNGLFGGLFNKKQTTEKSLEDTVKEVIDESTGGKTVQEIVNEAFESEFGTTDTADTSSFWSDLWNNIVSGADGAKSGLTGLVDNIKSWFSTDSSEGGLLDTIVSWFDTTDKKTTDCIKTITKNNAAALEEQASVLQRVTDSDIVEPMGNTLAGMERTLRTTGKQLPISLTDGVLDSQPETAKKVNTFWDWLENKFKSTMGMDENSLNDESLRSWITELWGSSLIESMGDGMEEALPGLLKKIEDICESIKNAFQEALKGIFDDIGNLFDDLFSKFDELGEKIAGITSPFEAFTGKANVSSLASNPFTKFSDGIQYDNWLNNVFQEMTDGIEYENFVSEIATRFHNAWAANVGSIGSNIFETFDDEQKYWAWDLTDNMETQIEGVGTWLTNYNKLLASELDAEFTDYLYSLGINGSGFVKEYAALIDDGNVEELQRASETYQKLMSQAAEEAVINSETRLRGVERYKESLQKALELGATSDMMDTYRSNGMDNQNMLQSWLHMDETQRADYLANWKALEEQQEALNVKTYEETLATMQKNIDLVSKWKDNVNSLVGKACDGIITAIGDAGPESQELLMEMLQVPEDKWPEINAKYEEAQKEALSITPELMLSNIKTQTQGITDYYKSLGELSGSNYAAGLKQYVEQFGINDQSYLNALLLNSENEEYVKELNAEWEKLSVLEGDYLKRNMQTQIDGFEEWKAEYEYLKSIGTNDKLLASFAEAGPDNQKNMQAMLASLRQYSEDSEEFRTELKTWNDLYVATQNVELREQSVTVEELISNMDSNLQGYQTVWDNLKLLTEMGFEDAVTRPLQEKGMAAAETIAALTTATAEQVNTINENYKAANQFNVQEAANKMTAMVDTYSQLETQLTKLNETGKASYEVFNWISQQAMTSGGAEQALHTVNSLLESIGKGDGYAETIFKNITNSEAMGSSVETFFSNFLNKIQETTESSKSADGTTPMDKLAGVDTESVATTSAKATEGAVEVVGTASDAMKTCSNQYTDAGSMGMIAYTDGVESETGTVQNGALTTAEAGASAAGSATGSYFAAGASLGAALASGISSAAGAVASAVGALVSQVESACSSMASSISSVLTDLSDAQKNVSEFGTGDTGKGNDTTGGGEIPAKGGKEAIKPVTVSVDTSSLSKTITASVTTAYTNTAKQSLDRTNTSSTDKSTTTNNNVTVNQTFNKYESSPTEIYMETYRAGLA